MVKVLKLSFLGFLALLLFASFASAFDMEQATCTFYGGLADILQKNIDVPDRGVREVQQFLEKNRDIIEEMQMTVEDKRRKAQESQYAEMSEEEIEKKMKEASEAMEVSKGVQEMDRFMEAINNFAIKNPEHSQKVFDLIEQYMPQPKEDY